MSVEITENGSQFIIIASPDETEIRALLDVRTRATDSGSAWCAKQGPNGWSADRETVQEVLALQGERLERMFHDHGNGEVEVNG